MALSTQPDQVFRCIVAVIFVKVMDAQVLGGITDFTARGFILMLICINPFIIPTAATELMVLFSPLVSAASNAHSHIWVFTCSVTHDIFASFFPSAVRTEIHFSCPPCESSPTSAADKFFFFHNGHSYISSIVPYRSPTLASALRYGRPGRSLSSMHLFNITTASSTLSSRTSITRLSWTVMIGLM